VKVLRVVSYLILAVTAQVLLIITLVNTSYFLPAFNLVMTLNLLMLFALVMQWKNELKTEYLPYKLSDLLDIGWIILACFGTYFLHNQIPFISAVLASAGIGLLGSLFAKDHELAIYAGTFAGMASAVVFPFIPLMSVSMVVGLVFVITKPLYKGVGGKLGTIAFVGALFTSLIWNTPFSSSPDFSTLELFALIGVGVFAAVSTRIISIRFKTSVVFASAIVGVVLAVIFDYLPFGLSPYLAICGFGASFVGMSNQSQIKSPLLIGFGGLIFSVLYASGIPILGGAGGKLGTTAFIASLAVMGILYLIPNKARNHSQSPNQSL